MLARLASGRHCGFAAEAAREPLAARFYDAGFVVPRNLHAVERNRWLAAAALDYAQDTPLDYGIRSDPLAADWLPPEPYAVLLTATSRADKLWPDTHWLAVCAGLHARGMAAVLPGGSEDERARARRLAGNARRAVAAPPLKIRQLAGLMAGARIVVACDLPDQRLDARGLELEVGGVGGAALPELRHPAARPRRRAHRDLGMVPGVHLLPQPPSSPAASGATR